VRGREPLAVWSLLGVVAVEIVVTYSRLPARELYHVTGSGIGLGTSRVLAYLNFPVALVAIAIAAISRRRTALLGALLCTPVFWPGVVKQSNLDARWVNAIAAVGVVVVFAATVTTARAPSDPRGDRVRAAIAPVALVVALPWLAAELGFFFPGPHVHHGHHHGMDGVLFVLSALLLSRQATGFGTRAYLALMFSYGVGNILNDAWGEQVVARGWTSWSFPSVLEPRPTWAWLVILLATAAITAVWLRLSRPELREDVRHLESAADGI
jgi:hypothetical protein